MRRWIPGSARQAGSPTATPTPTPAPLNLHDLSERDLAFCTEFAAHGGVAASEQGFKAETELTRMQRAGLLVLQRDRAPPFAVLQVSLSPPVRELLSNTRAAVSGPSPKPRAAPLQATLADKEHCRKGFEVARGMIGAVIRAEWSKSAGQCDGLEDRIMARIGALQDPFGP